MPTTGAVSRMLNWAPTQRHIILITTTLVAIPTAHFFESFVGGIPGRFFLLSTMAVGVAKTYEDHWPKDDQTWKAVVWIPVACGIITIEFIGLYVAGTAIGGLPPFLASVGAFLVTFFGNDMLLSLRKRR